MKWHLTQTENNTFGSSIRKYIYRNLLGTMNFPVVPKGIWVQEGLCTGGTCQPHLQIVSAHMCTDGSMWGWQHFTAPSTLHLYTLLMPQTTGKGVPCGWGWPPPELGTQLRREPPAPVQPSTTGVDTLGLTPMDSWGGGLDMVVVGAGQHFVDRGGWRTWGNVIWLPSRAHTGPLLLILPLSTWLSAPLLSPTAALLPIVSWPISTNAATEKRKKEGVGHKGHF